jgi:iron complex outermembrane recepter protein
MRIAIVVTALCISAVGLSVASNVEAAIRKSVEIPAEGLGPALKTLAKDLGFQVVFRSEVVGSARTRGASGDLTVTEALSQLLEGTDLAYLYLDDRTVTIVPRAELARQSIADPPQFETQAAVSDPDKEAQKSDSLRLAQANQGSSSGSSTLSTPPQSNSSEAANATKLAEIIVTAQKRSERLQDVPVPVTVLNADTLAERDQIRIQDYFAQVPGLNLTNGGGGLQTLALRGVITGVSANPTVAVTIDDVPFGSSTQIGGGNFDAPDIDPSDLERIEVLRGPQGALYGADSMGGLIKYVTKDPSTEEFSGRVQVLGNDVYHGELGYGVRGAVNVPLSDTFAIRASAFTRRDPGFIENILTGQNDVNRVDVDGGRLSALWRPSDSISLKLGALYQSTTGYGNQAVDATLDADGTLRQPLYGYQEQSRLRGTEGYSSQDSLYTATLTAKLGGLDFISISGYGIDKSVAVIDYTGAYGGPASQCPDNCAPSQQYYGVAAADNVGASVTRKFTQEFRVSSIGTQTLEWLLGAFYTHESTPNDNAANAADSTTGSPVGLLIDYNDPSTFSEYALFGDLTVHFTDKFDIQFGGRESENRQIYNETDSGPLVPVYFGESSPFVNPTERSSGNAFTYLLTPRFKLSPDLMVYARFTSGYRPGGNNYNAFVDNVPANYAPDKTNDYELGVKAKLFDGALTFDAAAYYIAWKRVQLALVGPTGVYDANAGDAKSQGLELSLKARPAQGLTLGAEASLNEAVLTQDLPPSSTAIGSAGDRLPYSSPFSGSLSVDQDIALVSNWTGFLGASFSYVGARESEFVTNPAVPRIRFPAYTDFDLRAGTRYDTWTVGLFVNNVANQHGVLGGGPNYAESAYYAVYVQPRTLGLSVTKTF